jgi:hypothetical protein
MIYYHSQKSNVKGPFVEAGAQRREARTVPVLGSDLSALSSTKWTFDFRPSTNI